MNTDTSNAEQRDRVRCSALLGDGISNLVTLKEWEKSLGVSSVTLWRWRCAGMFSAVNINGRKYVTKDEIRAFEARSIKGDYSEGNHCGSNTKNGGKSPNNH